jgi:3-phenylpropionate/trans-cinnamate dioxygenase ferredoxin reductase subunit
VIGGGQAGAEAAFRLRQLDFKGEIDLVCEEPLPPYQRPPLSKKYLSGELPEDRLPVKPAEAYAEAGINLVLGRKASWVDRTHKNVRIDGGKELPYDALVLATGSRARKLTAPGADLPGVHVLRSPGDVDAVRADLAPGMRVAVIGAGYIGLETAAVLRGMGHEVIVIEAAARPLARVTSPEVAGFFLDEHTAKGVRFALSAMCAVVKGDMRVRAVGLTDGSEIEADLVVAGIGISPEVSLAEAMGLNVENGIVVDGQGRTSDPSVYAIGDCARRPIHLFDCSARLESVHNALEGGKIVAAAIMRAPPPAEEAPWFWSDQYDLKLQIAGLFQGYDRTVLRGDPASRSFACFYLRAGKLIAVNAVNRPAEYLGAKQIIQRRASVAPALLSDMSKPFKEIVAAAA